MKTEDEGPSGVCLEIADGSYFFHRLVLLNAFQKILAPLNKRALLTIVDLPESC